MINKPLPLKGLNVRTPAMIPSKGRGLIHQGSTLAFSVRIIVFLNIIV